MEKQWRSLNESKQYHDGKFWNQSPTPTMSEDTSFIKVLYSQLNKPASVAPAKPLPVIKTDLHSLRKDKPSIVWFGHSSYLVQYKGINILVDPVFSGHASPFSFMVKAFPGADLYKPADMPAIDILVITHNHYDHLDKKAIAALQPNIKSVYTSLGVGQDLVDSGISDAIITEMDWWETQQPLPGITLTAAPARHFSGRGLKRAGSLWSSFVLKLYDYTIYLGGDSGYDTHFKAIGEQYGPFDIAILECGQYNTAWPFIHMMPEETAQAAIDLHAKVLLPVHWAKFTLASHPWNEPIERVVKAATEKNLSITTPLIGEPVVLDEQYPRSHWWL